MIKIVATSDIHGYLPQIESCDILIIAGDVVPPSLDNNTKAQIKWEEHTFTPWLNSLDAKHIIIVAGNHDNCLERHFTDSKTKNRAVKIGRAYLLCNTLIEIDKLLIYGAPLVTVQSNHQAFTLNSNELERCCDLIPDKIDILITHNPPFDVDSLGYYPRKGRDCGNPTISKAIKNRDIKHFICGHVHEASHTPTLWHGTTARNVSYCNSDNIATYPIHIIHLENLK